MLLLVVIVIGAAGYTARAPLDETVAFVGSQLLARKPATIPQK
jgi:hypothetical protein